MPHDQQETTTHDTLAVIQRMEAALAANSNDMAAHFREQFRLMGNTGCGTKNGLEEFRRNWQLPLRAVFTKREYKTEQFIAQGEWASCFGHIEATHSGEFMGVPPISKRDTIPYMDFWKVRDSRTADNWVSVDFPKILSQFLVDVFADKEREAYDRGDRTPPKH